MNKPLFLVDLDDTLFQTKRKMTQELGQEPVRVGALDRSLTPRSFMNQKQAMLVDWLLECSELIPVTARGTDEIARVEIPFRSWQITTHGAVILQPNGQPDAGWQQHILDALAPYTAHLLELERVCNAVLKEQQVDGWVRINHEYDGQPVYLVMKHSNSNHIEETYAVADEVAKHIDLSGYYVHRNGNNIAWLPHCIEKGKATAYLLKTLQETSGTRPVIGLGDSLSDHRFLTLCDFWGMPSTSQFATHVDQSFHQQED